MGQCVSSQPAEGDDTQEWAAIRRVAGPFHEKVDAALKVPSRHGACEKVFLFSSHHVMEYIFLKRDQQKRVHRKPMRISEHAVFCQLPEPFSYQIDAAIPVHDKLCYLISGNSIINYNHNPFETGQVNRVLRSPTKLRDHPIYSQLPPPFLSCINAGYVVNKTLSYYFCGDLVLAYNHDVYTSSSRIKKSSRSIAKCSTFGQIPPTFHSKVDAAFGHQNTVYMFHKSQVIQYNSSKKEVVDMQTFSRVKEDIEDFTEEKHRLKSGDNSPIAQVLGRSISSDYNSKSGDQSPLSPSGQRPDPGNWDDLAPYFKRPDSANFSTNSSRPDSWNFKRPDSANFSADNTRPSSANLRRPDSGNFGVDNLRPSSWKFRSPESATVSQSRPQSGNYSVAAGFTFEEGYFEGVNRADQGFVRERTKTTSGDHHYDSAMGSNRHSKGSTKAVTVGNDTAVGGNEAAVMQWLENAPDGISPEALAIFVGGEMGPGAANQKRTKASKSNGSSAPREPKSGETSPILASLGQQDDPRTNNAEPVAGSPLGGSRGQKLPAGSHNFKNTGAFSLTLNHLHSQAVQSQRKGPTMKHSKTVKS